MPAIKRLPGVWLMVVGQTNPGVLTLAQQHGIDGRLWQTGYVPDHQAATYLACADVMCMPMTDTAANRGRLPNKLLDYMAAGRPVVASPVGDVKLIVQNYGIGLLAEPEQFATVLAALLGRRGPVQGRGQGPRRSRGGSLQLGQAYSPTRAILWA